MAKITKQNIPFTQVANEVLNDKKLSWKAKGLFAYLFSKPANWNFESRRIANESSDGRDATRAAIKELEERGYLEREKLPTRRMKYTLKYSQINVTENPSLTMTENPNDGKSNSGKTRHISNKEEDSNKELISNKDISKEIGAEAPTYGKREVNEVIAYLQNAIQASLDGTQKENRRFANLLVERFRRDYPSRDPVDLIKRLINAGSSDSFHAKNVTNFKYLYYNAQKIIQSAKGEIKKSQILKIS